MKKNSFLNRTLYSTGFILALILIIIFTNCQNKATSTNSADDIAVKNLKFDSTDIKSFDIDASIRAIYPVDDNTLWYGGSGGQFGYTEDGGKTWTIDSILHPEQPNLEFRSIAIENDNVFLLSVASPALLFKSADKGKTWEVVYQENDSTAFYDAMAFWDEKEGIAMGDPTDACLSIIKTKDGGNTWTKISCDNLPEVEQGEAAFAASNSNISLYKTHVWIVSGGKKARVFHSSDRGEKWEVYDTPIVQGGQMTGIFTCDFYDENTGIIMGGDWNAQEKNIKNKAITHDGGKTWTLIAEGKHPGYRSCVQFIGADSSKDILAVGIPGIAYSADGGDSWSQITDQSFYTFRKANQVIWLAGSKKIGRWVVMK